MACFVVPVAEAVITTIAEKVIRKNEIKKETETGGIKLSEKLRWLNGMLWGGSALLAFEHIWHGEVTPFFPFLTAASDPESKAVMLHEMSTSGVAMSVTVTLAWLACVAVSSIIMKKSTDEKGERA